VVEAILREVNTDHKLIKNNNKNTDVDKGKSERAVPINNALTQLPEE
jgi:hypothetical protein